MHTIDEHGRVTSTQYPPAERTTSFTAVSIAATRHGYLNKPHANSRCLFATHRLRVERCSRNFAGHLDDRKRVPLASTDHWRIDVDVRSRLKCVPPSETPQWCQRNAQVSHSYHFEGKSTSPRGRSDGVRLKVDTTEINDRCIPRRNAQSRQTLIYCTTAKIQWSRPSGGEQGDTKMPTSVGVATATALATGTLTQVGPELPSFHARPPGKQGE